MAAQQDQDRTLEASPFKLQKARERGQIAKSPMVASTIVFAVAMVYLASQGWPTWERQFLVDRSVLANAAALAADPRALWPLMRTLLTGTFWLAAPLLFALVVAAILGNVVQSGVVFSAEPLKPDFSRLNPVTGLKRVFSMRGLFVLVRSLLKLLFIVPVTWWALESLAPQLYRLSSLPVGSIVRLLLKDCGALGLRMAGVLVLIALVDWLFSRREFARNMRMSKRELKDEFKSREGDPRVRSRIRSLRREMLKRAAALRNTRDADVLITNPIHVAVALRYVQGQMASPQVVAKGRGFMAAAMRAIAARHRIPVVPSPSLARALYKELAVDQHVRPHQFAAVARIIVWVFARRDAARRRAAGATATAGAA